MKTIQLMRYANIRLVIPETIIIKTSLSQYDIESAQTALMYEHYKACFHNTNFLNCHQKARGEEAGQATLHGYFYDAQ